jgi:hypothetical protein
MTFEEFARCVQVEFGIPIDIEAKSSLVDDLGLDSLDLHELIIFAMELAGVDRTFGDPEYPVGVTMGDIFGYLQHMEIQISASSSSFGELNGQSAI